MTIAEIDATPGIENDKLQIKHFDYIELYVGNPLQAAHFYRTAMGFAPVAYAGLETGVRDRISYVLAQGEVRLVLTGGLNAESPIVQHVARHGDSVKDIAFAVENVWEVFQNAIDAGARPLQPPTVYEDANGRVIKATIAAYNETVHTFVQRDTYAGPFLPGYRAIENARPAKPTGLIDIDHVAIGMEHGKLDYWVEFYKRVLSFHELHEEMIATERSSMNSKVVEDTSRRIKFPIVEATQPNGKSQINEYLDYHNGAGAQHIAFLCNDIIDTVRTLSANGIEFLATVPSSYYDMLEDRVGQIDPAILAGLREQRILVDRDDWGTLMQIFSRPIQGRPTLFLEIVQRNGARGFGAGNIKALFEAVEREQARRGNA
ncbi:MAG TPA: 4-hydroxyphenylpyruvate dioxygenase [Roseiflexaceae bacterium]|nr:4-hydroxyphenylpyruvate dioxygenase [Roseiflexaceae bacterium]